MFDRHTTGKERHLGRICHADSRLCIVVGVCRLKIRAEASGQDQRLYQRRPMSKPLVPPRLTIPLTRTRKP